MINYPDFFLVGAAKAGTTALQQAFDAHPDIYMSPLKEPNFFCTDIQYKNLRDDVKNKLAEDNIPEWIAGGMKTLRWRAYIQDEKLYEALFSPSLPSQKKGEASVAYLYSKNAASEIFKANSAAKIIMILRNPIERAFSHFNMELRMNWMNENLHDAIQNNKTNSDPIWGHDPLFLSAGLYYEQVKRYLNVFPKEQILILLYDDYKLNPIKTLTTMFDFIGVDSSKLDLSIALQKSNEARDLKIGAINAVVPSGALKVRLRRILKKIGLHRLVKNAITKPSALKLQEEDKNLLIDYYLNDINNLEPLLNIDLSNWKK